MERQFSFRIAIACPLKSFGVLFIYRFTADYGTEGLEVCLHYVPPCGIGYFSPLLLPHVLLCVSRAKNDDH
jgi:hypothetical protein